MVVTVLEEVDAVVGPGGNSRESIDRDAYEVNPGSMDERGDERLVMFTLGTPWEREREVDAMCILH